MNQEELEKQAEEKINIQDEVSKIHQKFGTSEMANYKIQLLVESVAKKRV